MAAGFAVAAALTLVLVPWGPEADPLIIAFLVVLYALVSRIEFEVGNGYGTPEQLVLMPLLFLAPLPLVPVLVATGFLLGRVRTRVGRDDRGHALSDVAGTWFALGPVWVLALLAPGEAPAVESAWIYVLAFAAQVLVGTIALMVHDYLAGSPQDVPATLWSYRVDAVLAPVGLVLALQAVEEPSTLIAVIPLAWLLHVFSHERTERYTATLELQNAYRGTVMLLSDVVEAEDDYTAFHCRSVVELVAELAEELQIPKPHRQELEFAALLHDVGKIAIPKEILNKPSKLTDEEFELIKTHTIEGQQLLDRVGGLMGRVGKVVRSCHERWDGGGYPDGLAGTEIPLAARIVFCCDAYNAMTTDRPYRKAMRREDALREIRENAGTQFDPAVAAALEHVVLNDDRYPRLVESVAASHAVAAAIGAPVPLPQRDEPAAAAAS
ncbi:MAG TPA: HD-GYP domain-containing protein [Thermoleophilaceae bacterium]|nr:HD-GYP domain-containing protein [Thermoleophilaceae bacterium]